MTERNTSWLSQQLLQLFLNIDLKLFRGHLATVVLIHSHVCPLTPSHPPQRRSSTSEEWQECRRRRAIKKWQ